MIALDTSELLHFGTKSTPKKNPKLDRFAYLTRNDLEEWAGSKIESRGKSYQDLGRVCDLAGTENNGLINWVDGRKRYAVRVGLQDDGLLESICPCPFELDCKRGVAVVIEYLKRLEGNQPVLKASMDEMPA
jgi:uncharacterized Zn finger protein